MAAKRKRILFVNRRAPYGGGYAQESLEAALMATALEQEVSLAFIDDGVYLLLQNQNTEQLGVKQFTATYRALGDFEANALYVEAESLQERGLDASDLVRVEADASGTPVNLVRVVSSKELSTIMARQDVLLNA